MSTLNFLFGLCFIWFSTINCCPIICFYESNDKIVDCIVKSNFVPKNMEILKCTLINYLDDDILNIGSGEILNGFQPNSLKSTTIDYLKISNVYLNISIGIIDTNSFIGSLKQLQSVFLYSVNKISIDTFSAMSNLKELQIEILNSKHLPQYLIINSTNIDRKIYLRFNAVCYSCPTLNIDEKGIYIHIIPPYVNDTSVIYSNINLLKCKPKYTENICLSNSKDLYTENNYRSKTTVFWFIVFMSVVTFIMVILLSMALFYIKKRYKRDIRSLKNQYVFEVLQDQKKNGFTH